MQLTRSVQIAFAVFGLIIVSIAGYFVYVWYQNPSKFPLFNKPDESAPIVEVKEDGEVKLTDAFFARGSEITYDEVVEKSPELAESSGITTTEDAQKFNKMVLKNREPEHYFVTFSTDGLSSRAMFITQGDYITILNQASSEVVVSEQFSPKTEEEKIPVTLSTNQSSTMGFDIIGEYMFKVNDIDFKVYVESVDNE